MKRFALLAFSLLAPLLSPALEAPDAADSYIMQGAPTRNFGAMTSMNVKVRQNAYVKFDLSGLPAGTIGSQVSKATLRLWVSRVMTAGKVDIAVPAVDWQETTLKGSNAPDLSVIEIEDVNLPLTATRTFVSIDVTSLVRDWVDGTLANNGIGVRPGTNSTPNVFFDTKENSHQPVLDITLASQGIPGKDGVDGKPGPQGPQGEPGVGIQGIQGEKGEKGDPGASIKGDPGKDGKDGTNGTNAVEYIYGDGSAGAYTSTDGAVLDESNPQYTDFVVNGTLTVPSGMTIRCSGSFTNNGMIIVTPEGGVCDRPEQVHRGIASRAASGDDFVYGYGMLGGPNARGIAFSPKVVRTFTSIGPIGGGSGQTDMCHPGTVI